MIKKKKETLMPKVPRESDGCIVCVVYVLKEYQNKQLQKKVKQQRGISLSELKERWGIEKSKQFREKVRPVKEWEMAK